MSQEILNIKIEDLVLWTENPRDPIDKNALDQDIVDKALADEGGVWDLDKLAKSMGDFYDFSELPIVVYEDNKPIVYDGNRRVILAKIYHGLVIVKFKLPFLPRIPVEIPCNVCSQDIALKSILRKHGDSGSWNPLERDIFVAKYKLGEKSTFLLIEEKLGIITENPFLNQRFVKEEIFNNANLEKIGFRIENDEFQSRHTKEISEIILSDLINKIRDKKITTRTSRGKVYEILDSEIKDWIENDKEKNFKRLSLQSKSLRKNIIKTEDEKNDTETEEVTSLRKTKRIKEPEIPIFGQDLYLKKGGVNNLYRDICELHAFYKKQKTLTSSFAVIIRMSLRLLWETAAKNIAKKPDRYILCYFEDAKKTLGQDYKTLLSNHSISITNLPQLLHTGAHSYSASQNYEQTIAISIILGAMLSISHRRQ